MGKEVYRITTEDADGVIFATRHEWSRIHEEQLPELNGYTIIGGFFCGYGIYQIVRDSSPAIFPAERFKLLKHTVDEETGKNIMLSMDISREEVTELINSDRKIL